MLRERVERIMTVLAISIDRVKSGWAWTVRMQRWV
jgi:hypothetical protein